MNHTWIKVLIVLVVVFLTELTFAKEAPKKKALLDENLSAWEVWTGVPSLGLDLPEGYSRGDDPKNVPAIGLGDPFGLFSMQRDTDGSWILFVSGKSRGALTTKAEYADYHLSLQFKWGEQDGTISRDSGLLYHGVGPYGGMWNNLKRSLELQLQDGAIGDLYLLGGFEVLANLDENFKWDPTKKQSKRGGGMISKIAAAANNESPLGEWTQLDIYVQGDSALHVVNGRAVVAFSGIELEGKEISAGVIQIQSGSSPCYFKNVRISKITELPKLSEFK